MCHPVQMRYNLVSNPTTLACPRSNFLELEPDGKISRFHPEEDKLYFLIRLLETVFKSYRSVRRKGK